LVEADLHSREAIEVKRTLLARDTENVDSRFHLATSLAYGGVLRADIGDDAGAKALLEEALEILTPLDYPRKGACNAMLGLVKTQLDTLKSKSNRRRSDGADAQN
jgi:hypothetical protein